MVEHTLGKGEVTAAFIVPVISSRVCELAISDWRFVNSITNLESTIPASAGLMDQDKKFWIAMAAYAGLAVLAWATMTNAGVQVAGNGISLRGLVWILLGFFAARTALHWRAEKIRAERGE